MKHSSVSHHPSMPLIINRVHIHSAAFESVGFFVGLTNLRGTVPVFSKQCHVHTHQKFSKIFKKTGFCQNTTNSSGLLTSIAPSDSLPGEMELLRGKNPRKNHNRKSSQPVFWFSNEPTLWRQLKYNKIHLSKNEAQLCSYV